MTALALAAKTATKPPAEEPEDEGDQEYVLQPAYPDRTYRINDPLDEPSGLEDEDEEEGYSAEQQDFLNQQAWRLLMRAYVAVAESCSPPASVRKVKEATGWHHREQATFRGMLVTAGLAVVDGGGVLAWTSTKAQRRKWLSDARFPTEPPPLQKAPHPTLDPSPEVI